MFARGRLICEVDAWVICCCSDDKGDTIKIYFKYLLFVGYFDAKGYHNAGQKDLRKSSSTASSEKCGQLEVRAGCSGHCLD